MTAKLTLLACLTAAAVLLCSPTGALAEGTAPSSSISVSWITPQGGANITTCSVPLSASVSDSAGTITSVLFLDVTTGRILGSTVPSNGTATATWDYTNGLSNGTHKIEVRAADAQNNHNLSPVITVTVAHPACAASGGGSAPGGSGPYTLTVNAGSGATGGGVYAAGAPVTISAGVPPYGQEFLAWSGTNYVSINDSSSSTTTITMPAANTTVTAQFGTAPASIPEPVSTHPRLWITQADLPRLQSWATSSNPIWENGLLPDINQAVSTYQSQFAPFFGPNPPSASNYPDPGDTQGYVGPQSEQLGVLLAFASLVSPNVSLRPTYAGYARNLLMYAMNLAALGPASAQPFRDPLFPLYNRANNSGQDWPLIVDWIYPYLSASDKATIQKVFMLWASECLRAYTAGGDHPSPVNFTNTTALLPGNNAYRMAANNYYLGHARLLTMMALSLDPSDDPPVNTAISPNALGNTLRSYLPDATGAWLYQEYAMFGDPSAVRADYGLPGGSGVGLTSGGMPPEGWLYGHSFGYLAGWMLALQTAGLDDSSLIGPQAHLITAPFWHRMVNAFYSDLVPNQATLPGMSWMGPVFQMASYGDLIRLWITPDMLEPMALLTQIERQAGEVDSGGNPVDDNAARWWEINALQGGPGAIDQRMTDPWSDDEPIEYFLSLPPGEAAPTDPRPSLPLTFVDPGQGRVVSRTSWNSDATMFDYRGSWESINHQNGDAGMFEFYRHSEWLTKEMSNYDNAGVGQTSAFHNTLSLQEWAQNNPPTGLGWFEHPIWTWGGQFYLGQSAGDPVTNISYGPSYTFAQSDLTKLYQRPDLWTPANNAVAVQQASRAVAWIDSDYIVTYDRVTDSRSGLFKKYNLELTNQPTISPSGTEATEVTPGGQELYVQALLPADAQLTTWNGAAALSSTADGEPTQWTLTDEDPSEPADVRFLHVLQGADPGAPMAQATLEQSSAGDAFDGAAFGSDEVFFTHNYNQSVSHTTLPLPAGVHTVLVTGLAPGASYSVTPASGSVSVAAGASDATADSAGVLRLTF